MKVTKQLLKDELFEFKQNLQQRWESASSVSLDQYLREVDRKLFIVEDFIDFFIERNFKR